MADEELLFLGDSLGFFFAVTSLQSLAPFEFRMPTSDGD